MKLTLQPNLTGFTSCKCLNFILIFLCTVCLFGVFSDNFVSTFLKLKIINLNNITHELKSQQEKGSWVLGRAQLIFKKFHIFFCTRNLNHCLPLEAQIWVKYWSRRLWRLARLTNFWGKSLQKAAYLLIFIISH